jgi:hypothetical protein
MSKCCVSYEETVAFHEAGHAVMSWLVRRAIKSVTIIAGDGYAGQCITTGLRHRLKAGMSHDRRARAFVEREVMLLVAGRWAERHLRGLVGRYNNRFLASRDWGWAKYLAAKVTDSPAEAAAFLDWLFIRAGNVIAKHFALVRIVAEELLEKGTLSGRRVRGLLEVEAEGLWGKAGTKRLRCL